MKHIAGGLSSMTGYLARPLAYQGPSLNVGAGITVQVPRELDRISRDHPAVQALIKSARIDTLNGFKAALSNDCPKYLLLKDSPLTVTFSSLHYGLAESRVITLEHMTNPATTDSSKEREYRYTTGGYTATGK